MEGQVEGILAAGTAHSTSIPFIPSILAKRSKRSLDSWDSEDEKAKAFPCPCFPFMLANTPTGDA